MVAESTGRSPNLIAIETEGSRLSRFIRPRDPEQFWIEEPFETEPPLVKPRAMSVADLDRDGRAELYVADRSRLLVYRDQRGMEAAKISGAVEMWAVEGKLWILGPGGVSLWSPEQ
jgi:hypothetical protein